MKLHKSLTPDRIIEAVQADDNLGFCVKCGSEHGSLEPDARRRPCEYCGDLYSVYGAEELLIQTGIGC